MITWVLYLCIGIVVGGMAGYYFAKLDDLSKKQKQELEDKLQKSEQELVDYKDQVTTHFKETANLINNMTESYQKVHEHLAAGSVELCNNAIEVNKLTVSSKQLSSLTETTETTSDEEVTSLADSEAPKTDTVNNNKNQEEPVAEAYGDSDPNASATEPQQTEHYQSENLSASSDPAPEDTFKPEEINPPQQSATDSVENTQQDKNEDAVIAESQVTETHVTETHVTETMAVAEDDSGSDQEKPAKNRLPGSRMVH